MHTLKKVKILLKNSLMSPEIEHKMHHSEKFLIDIDNVDSETSSEESESVCSHDHHNEKDSFEQNNDNDD